MVSGLEPPTKGKPETVPRCIEQLLEETGLTLNEIDTVICHQANKRINDSIIRRLKGDPNRFLINLRRYGNTSSASIPLALYELEWKPGSRIVCAGFGGGLTYGAVLLTL